MSPREWTLGVIFLLQTTVGILGNCSLLFYYLFLYFTKIKLRSTDLTLIHLAVGNSLLIVSKGIPKIMASFGWTNFFNDVGCKLVLYVHRVGRGVSISSTCLLSIFQVLTISPGNSKWAELKVKAPKYVGFYSFLCWILHLLVNIVFPIFVISNWSNKTITNRKDYGHCSSVRHDKTADSLYAALLSFPDAVFLSLMLWASGTMVFILHRHKQRLRLIHKSNVFPRSSVLTRATQTILVLVSTFVCFYALSSLFQALVSTLYYPNWWLLQIDAFTGSCFPMVSPFVIMIRDSSVSRLCSAWIRKTKSPHPFRDI